MENKSLFTEYAAQKRIISDIRTELNVCGEKIRTITQKKRENGQQIAQRLRQVKKLREERDVLTTEVKNRKKKRALLQKQISKDIALVKGAKPPTKAYKNPAFLLKEIEKLEYRIETEGMKFDTEQKLMKKIKELQKQAEEAKGIAVEWTKFKGATKELDGLRQQSETEHKAVQLKASASQKKHEEMTAQLKEVDELRKKEKLFETEIVAMKKKGDGVREKLERELVKINELSKRIGEEKADRSEKKKKKIEERLASKTMSVEEKIKKGEKLTTQDLLAWQAKGK
jgi:uncharacterized coiled-coil DUF342 family protein